MKDIEGNESMDYFSQDTILDYIDGRLSEEDAASFELQMQQDETLQLAVEGIRGFYAAEQKDRPYLENIMSESEEALKGALAKAEAKTVALAARRRNIAGISIAACVALLMVFSLPHLLNNAESTQTQKTVAIAPAKDQQEEPASTASSKKPGEISASDEGAAETGAGSVTTSGNPDMLTGNVIALKKEGKRKSNTAPEKRTTDGDVDTEEFEVNLETVTVPPPPTIGLAPQKKNIEAKEAKDPVAFDKEELLKKDEITTVNKSNNFRKEEKVSTTSLTRSSARAKKRKKSEARNKGAGSNKKSMHDYLQGRSVSSTAPAVYGQEESTHYRVPGKLHLWVFTDDANMDYYTLMKVSRDIANNTGLQLMPRKISTAKFRTQQWSSLLKNQRPGSNDVVWIYYMGKNTPTTTMGNYNTKNKNNQNLKQLQASVNSLNNTLEYSNAALKLVTIDSGDQLTANNLAADDVRNSSNSGLNNISQKQAMVQGSRPAVNNAYKKLFLGNSGIITVLSNDLNRSAYQGIFTQNLIQALQNAGVGSNKSVDWKSVLKATEKGTKKQSRKLGKPQRMQKKKMKIKKSY